MVTPTSGSRPPSHPAPRRDLVGSARPPRTPRCPPPTRTMQGNEAMIASHATASVSARQRSDHRGTASHRSNGASAASAERSPASRIAVAASAIASIATHVSPPPTLIRCAPASTISATREARQRQHVDRLRDRVAHRADLLDARQARRVEHVGAGLLVRLEARDRVVQVGVAADVVLRARREHERNASARAASAAAAIRSAAWLRLIEAAARVEVLDRAAHRARLGHAA